MLFGNPTVLGVILFIILLSIALWMIYNIYRLVLSWRKLNAAPPTISIATDGIKRGLTVVEAAVLMELPLDKVIQLILFGALQKGAAEVTGAHPLKIHIADGMIETLHHYEITFLKAFGADDANASRYLLSVGLASLIENVSEKMKGFKRRETTDHYQSIVKDAWQEMKTADLPALKDIALDDIPGWTDIVKQYNDGMHNIFERSDSPSPINNVLEALSAQILEDNADPKNREDPLFNMNRMGRPKL